MIDDATSKKLSLISVVLVVMVVYIHAYHLDYLQVSPGHGERGFSWNVYIQCFVSQGLARVAIPLFFAISGYLFFRDFKASATWFLRKAKRRVRSLVIPYLSWSILGICSYALMQSVPQASPFFSKGLVVEYTYSQFIRTLFIDPIPYQLWFVRDLIVLVFLSPIILIIVSTFGWRAVFVLVILWLLGLRLPCLSLDGLAFFAIGCACSILHVDITMRRKNASKLLMIWLITQVTATYLWVEYDIGWGPLARAIVLLGVCATWFGYDSIKKALENRAIVRMTSYTFFIYAFHEPFLTVVKKLGSSIFGADGITSLLVFLLSPAVTIGVALLVGVSLRKHARTAYEVLVGWRSRHL